MTQQIINVGIADKGNGDPLRTAFTKVNENFTELYAALGLTDNNLNLGSFQFDGNTMSTTDSSSIVIDQAVTINSELTTHGDIVPNIDSEHNLGSPTRQWKSLYVSDNTIYINNVPMTLDAENRMLIDGIPISATIEYENIPNAPKDIANLTDNTGLLVDLANVDSITFWDSSVQTTAYRYAAQPTAPTMTTGALWFNSTDGRLYINYNNTWVDASPTEIDPNAIRFNEQNLIELPNSGLIGDNYDDGGAGIQAPPGSYAIINSNNQQQYVEADDSAVYIGTNWPDNNHNWTFSKDGKLSLPAGTSFEYFNTPLTGHGDGLALLDFALQTDGVITQWLAASPNPAGSGYDVGNTFTFDEEFLGIPGASVTIEVVSIGPGGSIVELGFTQPPLYPADIYRDSPINIQVGTESNRWTFKSDGDLKLPGGITAINSIDISAGDAVNISTNNTGSVKTWSFDEDGKLTLPGTIVSTGHLNLDADYDNGYSVYIGNDHPTAGMLGGVVIGDSRGGFVEFLTTKLIIGQTSVPTHSYGAPGDIAGEVAFDNDYIYYCKQNYVNNSTDIWVRVVWTDTNW